MANLDAAPTRVHARDQLCSGQHTKPVCACYRPAIALAVQTIIRTAACYRTVHMLPIRQRERLEGFPDATIRSERAPSSTDHFLPALRAINLHVRQDFRHHSHVTCSYIFHFASTDNYNYLAMPLGKQGQGTSSAQAQMFQSPPFFF